QRERRAHVRRSGRDLAVLKLSRLKHGPSVSLIDLSVGGTLLEADVQLKPGTRMALELALPGESPTGVAMRVLRCEVANVRREATLYRGACEFVKPLDLPILRADRVPDTRQFVGLDASLKMLAERSRATTGAALKTGEVLQVLRTLQARAARLESDGLAGP